MTQQTSEPRAAAPVAVSGAEGEAWWWGDALAIVKVAATETGGQMTILDVTEPPNAEAPLHVHHNEDEGFWILEGGATFEVGGQTIEAGVGDYLLGPRDIPHRFSTGPEGCRMLFIFTPGGFEELLRVVSRPAESRSLPPRGEGTTPSEEQMGAIEAAIQAHGCELLE